MSVARALHYAAQNPASRQGRWRGRQGVCSVQKENAMLYTIAVVLLILWLLGLVSGYTIGAFIHVLLVIAVVLLLVGLVTGRRVV